MFWELKARLDTPLSKFMEEVVGMDVGQVLDYLVRLPQVCFLTELFPSHGTLDTCLMLGTRSLSVPKGPPHVS